MANLLFLVHRLPYPPNKGDKVRSFHLLKHLAARHRVFVGTFVDDPADAGHVPTVRALCADACVRPLHPLRARLASLSALAGGGALTLRYYRDAALQRWVDDLLRRERIDAVVVFSSSMAQYAHGAQAAGIPAFVDFVDVDSAKWQQYAADHRWPLSWLYRREARELLACERAAALNSRRSFFVTQQEADLFCRLAPDCAPLVEAMNNGVDATYFAPDAARPSPFAADELPVVFTGAMDYWPNVDAVTWFAREMLPLLRLQWPRLRFHIVGRSPTPAVRALAGDGVAVSGTVPDVRPYLQHAAVVVAPLRLARGIQNKILEAMAMGRPVVAARQCAAAILPATADDTAAEVQPRAAGARAAAVGAASATAATATATATTATAAVAAARAAATPAGNTPHDAGLVVADDADGFVSAIDALLHDPVGAADAGAAARRRVLRGYSWDAHLAAFDRHLAALPPAPTQPQHAPSALQAVA